MLTPHSNILAAAIPGGEIALVPESPKPNGRMDPEPGTGDAAQKRAESLKSARDRDNPSPAGRGTSSGDGGDRAGRPALTERQRREARSARKGRRRRPEKGNPVSRALAAASFEVRRTVSFLGRALLAALGALGPVFSSVGMGLVWLVDSAGRLLAALSGLIARAIAGLGRALVAIDRVVTPRRALILVAGLATIVLGISQYKGLGSIEIGQPGYVGIEDLARAPAIDRTTPAGVHTRILVPVAAAGLLAAVVLALGSFGTFTKRFQRFSRLASMVLVAIGLLTLAVALLIDLPDATDTTEAALAYAGVRARLLSGFWLELAAGFSLTLTGLALLLEPTAQRARSRSRRPESTAFSGGRA